MDDEIDLRKYVIVLFRHWRLIAGLTLATAAAAFAMSSFLPKQYATSAIVAITNPRYLLQFDPRIETVSNVQINAKAYLGLATSDAVLAQLLEAPAVAPLIDGTGTIEDLRRMLAAKAGADPSLVVLTVTDTDPARAAAVANAWAELYVAYIGDVYGQAQPNQDFFETQGVSKKADYDTAQRALEEFLGNNSISKLQREINTRQTLIDAYQSQLNASQGQPLTEQLETRRQYLANAYDELVSLEQQQRQIIQDYYGQLTTIELLLSDARALREQAQAGNASSTANLGDALAQLLLRSRSLAGAAGGNVQLQISLDQAAGPVPVSDVDSLIDVLASRKLGIQAQIDALLQISRGETPDPKVEVDSRFGVLESRKAEAKTRIEALTAGLLAGLEVSDASLSNDPISQLIEQYSNEVLALTAQLEAEQAGQRELAQARDLTWETFTTIARKTEEARIATASGSGEVSLASAASVPTEKVGPKRTQNTALAGMVGLMLGVFAVFAAEWWQGGKQGNETA